MRVWRLGDGAPVGEPLRGHRDSVYAVATAVTADGTAVVASGGNDGTARVWRLRDGGTLVPPLALHEAVDQVALHGDVVVTTVGADFAVHQLVVH